MAGLVGQRMVSSNRTASITLWAWAASIIVHLTVLTAFGFVKFSQSKSQDEQNIVPTAKISRVKKLIESAPVIPKPKVKSPVEDRPAEGKNKLFAENQIFAAAKSNSHSSPDFTESSFPQTVSLPSGGVRLPMSIEFFGSFTDHRKVCYVVDCSGSMQGVFGRVKKELTESIQTLQQDQYFYIIFFGSGRLFESGDGRLVRVTEQAKISTYGFIDAVQPAGQTNALAALEKAVQIRSDGGVSPSVIYFLTDGFELTGKDQHRFLRKVSNLLKRFAPMTRVNTIGFWPADDDRKMLEAIAKQSGGECVFIEDY